MTYKLTLTGSVVRSSDGANIPPDPANCDWQEYQRWLAGGGVPAPADAAPAAIDVNDLQNMTKLFRAKCISDLAKFLNVAPGALTAAQINAERTRIKNIADAL